MIGIGKAILVLIAFAAGARSGDALVDLTKTFTIPSITANFVTTSLGVSPSFIPRSLQYDARSNSLLVLTRGTTLAGIISIPLPQPPQNEMASSGFPVGGYTILLDSTKTTGTFGWGLTHGLALSSDLKWIYASSTSTVFRWPYNGPVPIDANQTQVVLSGIPPEDGHNTRTIVLARDSSLLYVSIGAINDVDPDSTHARIVRFNTTRFANAASGVFPPSPLDWFADGVVVADGVRNAVAMRFDPFAGNGEQHLWEADNGPDGLANNTLGGNIAEENPGEELNLVRVNETGTFFGYPSCFTEGVFPKGYENGPLAQHEWPGFKFDCTNATANRPPILAMPAHVAPIDLFFFEKCNKSSLHSLPCEWEGNMFISLHGSLRRTKAPMGYKVVVVPFSKTRLPSSPPIDLFGHIAPEVNCPISKMKDCLRPAGLAFDAFGRLYVSLDSTGDIVVVRRKVAGDSGISSGPQTLMPDSEGVVKFPNSGHAMNPSFPTVIGLGLLIVFLAL
ncbi:soluble quino protein glucose dehydrogenase, partial [Gonapodya prolifera JEL478]